MVGAKAQPALEGAAETRLALERLKVLGSVLMIGAHPDDEHTNTLAYLARGRLVRAAYLSLTRGEGGQNLIGPEQGELLGLIRTEELLAARRIDGAEQFFTRAIDFGFSKSAEETLSKWGHDAILSDVVWVIRRYRPDVIVLCFSGTPRDGHGQHQAAGILGREAFAAAADRTRFAEQLTWVEPWQAKRAVWNVYGGGGDVAGRVAIDTGEYSPVLGHSYAEIAGMSRSMHRSQAMGSGERRGPAVTYLVPVAGAPASKDLFDGIDTTWSRVPGGAAAGQLLDRAAASFDALHPEKTIPLLAQARERIANLTDFWASRKLRELDEAIGLCAGLWLDAAAEKWAYLPGSAASISLTAINRSPADVRLTGIGLGGDIQRMDAALAYNQPFTDKREWTAPRELSQPYWLRQPRHGDDYTIPDQRLVGDPEDPPLAVARFRLSVDGTEIELRRPVMNRYVDRSRGELMRAIEVVPPIAVRFAEPVLVAPDARPREVEAVAVANAPKQDTNFNVTAPAGWGVTPSSGLVRLENAGEESPLAFRLTPPAAPGIGRVALKGYAGMRVISYPHIRPQVVFPPAEAEVVRADIQVLAKNIGYVMGAGDEEPEMLRQIGCAVTLLSPEDLATRDLAAFDAIVTGVRAYNTRPDLRANQHRLLDYVEHGGTLVVQYNTLEYGASAASLENLLGPYPIRIGRDRVSVEDAPVAFTNPSSPLLRTPNRITEADFAGWVQERGLYFASSWDPRYQTLFESHDPGEPPHAGGTLYTRFGRGAYVFTAYSWFRELPAGVPGAFRIFANLLSAGKALAQ